MHAQLAKNMLTSQCALHAYVLTSQRVLRTYMLTCRRALRAYMLTCQRALSSLLFTCQRILRAYVHTCERILRAHVPACLACSRAHMGTCFACLHAHVATCQSTLRAKWQRAFHPHVQKLSTVFFEVKLFFCPVFYWDEKSLLIKVEARRVTRNAFRHNGSFKIMISQNQLGFVVIRLINNRHFIGVDPVKHIKSRKQFFAKIVNALLPIHYFLKKLHLRCLTWM